MRDNNYLQIKPGIILNGRHMTYIKKEDSIHYFTSRRFGSMRLDRGDTGKEHRE